MNREELGMDGGVSCPQVSCIGRHILDVKLPQEVPGLLVLESWTP